MKKVIDENPTDIQLLKLDNIYASLVTLVALQLRQEEGETKKSFDPYIDEAHRLIMEAKQRLHIITRPEKHDYF